MSTIKKLHAYRLAMDKWANKKFRFELTERNGGRNMKPMESEPVLIMFGITSENLWAARIRAEVMRNLEWRLSTINNVLKMESPKPSGVKVPTRKI